MIINNFEIKIIQKSKQIQNFEGNPLHNYLKDANKMATFAWPKQIR